MRKHLMFEDEIEVPDTAETGDSGSSGDVDDDGSLGGSMDETLALIAKLQSRSPAPREEESADVDGEDPSEPEEESAARVTGPTSEPANVPYRRFKESRQELTATKRQNAQLESKIELLAAQYQQLLAGIEQHKAHQPQTRQEDEEIDYEKLYAEADPVTALAKEIEEMKAWRQAQEAERQASIVATYEQQYMAEIQAAIAKYPLAQHVPVELTTIMQREGCSAEVAAKRLHTKLGGAITPAQPQAVRRAAPLPPGGSGAVAARKQPERIGFDGSHDEALEWIRAQRTKGVRGQ